MQALPTPMNTKLLFGRTARPATRDRPTDYTTKLASQLKSWQFMRFAGAVIDQIPWSDHVHLNQVELSPLSEPFCGTKLNNEKVAESDYEFLFLAKNVRKL